MRKKTTWIFGFLTLIVALLGASAWLLNAPLHPPQQHMQVNLPDDRIPH